MAITRQDFIGFSFNGKHSSEFNIVRVSDGSRFKKDLLPTFQDKTVAVPGGDGSYLFGTNYTQKTRTINFAYDGLTEEKMFEMRRWLAANQAGELILDEWPYKAWDVKVSAPPNLTFIPFDEEIAEDKITRIYKGEGSISFVAYQPFAHNPSGKKWLGDYAEETNYDAWADMSGLQEKNGYDTINSGKIKVYNAGDLPCDFYLTFSTANGYSYNISLGGYQLNLVALANKRIRINTKLHLIEELNDNGELTGVIYNNWITSGDFFKLPLGESTLAANTRDNNTIITYHYRYLG